MADAGKTIDNAASDSKDDNRDRNHNGTNNYSQRKRKGTYSNAGRGHGSRGRGRGRGDKRAKKGDMGRAEYFASNPDKRARVAATTPKNTYPTGFSQEEIDAEERRPKRKVAVLIGYSGTGYKGMQISPSEKTIEGDLFKAFVAAGAISKANADDPKKASLVRCARTDKGVHAAGNMISLKLIVEDEDIVEKINSHLDPQIRVWGIERTIGSFSCYQACDSRWYEYLIPTYAFLPPHPSSWLARKLNELAEEANDLDGYRSRQKEVEGFWEDYDERVIKQILLEIEEDIRHEVVKALQGEDEAGAKVAKGDTDVEQIVKAGSTIQHVSNEVEEEKTEAAAIVINEPELESKDTPSDPVHDRTLRLRAAAKKLREAYTHAKKTHRISPTRVQRIQSALSKFVGTHNYHNYTIQKTYRDPSAKRHIKSFVVNEKPILITGDGGEQTEWLSMKVHGQSFMMHQIRKMVGMITLLVRCGSDLNTLDASLSEERFSIPKVPGLGLLLERPVFDSYNNLQAPKHNREPLDFGKFEKAMDEFKEREIYQRIFREEEERNEFARFFNHVDNFKEGWFLWVSSKGVEATRGAGGKKNDVGMVESDGEDGASEGG